VLEFMPSGALNDCRCVSSRQLQTIVFVYDLGQTTPRVRVIHFQRFLGVLVWIATHRVVVHIDVDMVVANCCPNSSRYVLPFTFFSIDGTINM